MNLGVLIVTVWFFAVAAVLVWQYIGGALARAGQERDDAAARGMEQEAATFEPVYALAAARYKRAKTPACTRRRTSAA